MHNKSQNNLHKTKILEVNKLSIGFMTNAVVLPVVDELSFCLNKGEILAIVGESGCGKTVSCMALARLLPEPPAIYKSGSIVYYSEDGAQSKNILSMKPAEIREIRKTKLSYVFQEPSVSLNPVFTIEYQIAEVIELRNSQEEHDVEEEIISLLSMVGIPDPKNKMKCYPHELSGGMQQRAMIAMALAGKRQILVADEPTTALDVTIQAQILELLKELREKTGMSMIIVTHNLGIVAETADNVLVMYAGQVVEKAPTVELISNPVHPYTKALLKAVPRFGSEKQKLETIPGNVPPPAKYPQGCRFFGRCSLAEKLSEKERELCDKVCPELYETRGHASRCHYSK